MDQGNTNCMGRFGDSLNIVKTMRSFALLPGSGAEVRVVVLQ